MAGSGEPIRLLISRSLNLIPTTYIGGEYFWGMRYSTVTRCRSSLCTDHVFFMVLRGKNLVIAIL